MNGHVTSFVYRDWIAVGCGVVAIMLGIIATGAARKEQLQRALAFAAGIGVVLLGGVQIARGFGVFADPGGSSSSSSTTFETTTTVPHIDDKPKGDPQSPDTCPDDDSCFNLGRALDQAKDEANAAKAYGRACDMGAMGGCFNAGLYFVQLDPPDIVKAEPYFAKSCEGGDPQACANVGRIYATEGATFDMKKAVAMFGKSCDGKLGLGCELLGKVYDQGLDGKEDFPKARELFEKACALQAPDSCFFLGEQRRQGLGGDKDAEGAIAAYTAGCKLDNQDACKALDAAATPPAKAPAKKKKRK